ncbi:DUF502 domain-containing protein [Algimonas porphyrae]|uniref:Membrane protein n=1 Tax=Algimonas porphyrae TaxID=1128113 RepID=A0ABQ5UVC8_9PROT|nr:DUF502 domain-containing protein [Algimonas porphyrae]GLQ19108.1 membrane protein [Algimonas porphyrae]
MSSAHPEIKVVPKAGRFRLFRWLRNRFIAGVLVALPIVAVIWLLSKLIGTIDNAVWSIVPPQLDPSNYWDFPFWGLSLVIAVFGLTLLGIFASNQVGTSVLRTGESILARVPVISPIYNGIKQILNTIAQQKDRAFRDVCLIEYPRKGIWAIGFVTADLSGAPEKELSPNGKDYVCVFVPTTPNPTSGFLLFVPTDEIKLLDMTPEEGAKMIISGGMVSSNEALEQYVAKKPTVPLSDETLSEPKP